MAKQVTRRFCPTSYNKVNKLTYILKHSKIHDIQSKTENVQDEDKHSIDVNQEEISKGEMGLLVKYVRRFLKT